MYREGEKQEPICCNVLREYDAFVRRIGAFPALRIEFDDRGEERRSALGRIAAVKLASGE